MAGGAIDGNLVRRKGWRRWIGYVVTVLLEVALTLGLLRLTRHFPLANFPIPYVLLIMLVAYAFGEGPAILALVIGFLCFTYALPPYHGIWPLATRLTDWAGIIAYLLGTVVVGFATTLMRRSRQRIQRLLDELTEAKQLAERQSAMLDVFLRNIPVGLGFHDRETRHIFANEALASLNRISLDRLIGRTVWEVLPPGLADSAAAAIRHVFDTGEPSEWRGLAVVLDVERYFDVSHVPVRTSDGEIIGVGVVVTETTEQVKARRRAERIADMLQDSLLSPVPPAMNGFRFDTVYRAALEEARVGGDFYDVFRLNQDKIGIVIGDVSGKGLNAAVQVAMAKYSLRSRAYDCDKPSIILEQVNNALVRDMDSESFATVFVGILDSSTRTLSYANGGHAPALLWRAGNREAVMLESTGLVLGAIGDMTYSEHKVELHAGDEILLGTDGLFEIRCDEDFLDLSDFVEAYAQSKRSGLLTADGLVSLVLDKCKGKLRDDVAILRVSIEEPE